LRNKILDVIKDLEKPFNESINLSAQEQLLQHGTRNRANEVLEVDQRSHDLLDRALLEDEVVIITKNDILKIQGQTNNVLKQCGGIEIEL
jgi:hypothetical protein